MAKNQEDTIYGSLIETKAHFHGEFAAANQRFPEVIRLCGEMRFSDIMIRPEIFHSLAPGRGEATNSHRHPFTEVTWLQGASMEYQHGTQRIRANPGDIFFMPALMAHSWRATAPDGLLHGFMLSIQQDLPGSSSTPFNLDGVAVSAGFRLLPENELAENFMAMMRHAQMDHPGSAAVAAGYMRVVLALLYQEIMQIHNAMPAPAPEESSRHFNRTRDYILTHLHRPLSLAEVAAAAKITPRHLNRIFTARLSLSAGAFILQSRINRACHLLHEPSVQIKVVARNCGFKDPAYFCRAFRKQIGQSPAAYASAVKS